MTTRHELFSARSWKQWLKPVLLLTATAGLYVLMMMGAHSDVCSGGSVIVALGPFVLGLGIWTIVAFLNALRISRAGGNE